MSIALAVLANDHEIDRFEYIRLCVSVVGYQVKMAHLPICLNRPNWYAWRKMTDPPGLSHL